MTDKLKELRGLIFKCEEVKKEVECKDCDGDGFTSEHSSDYGDHDEDGGCNGSCPVQAQCDNCRATGNIRDINLEDVLRAIIRLFSDAGIITEKTYHETFCEIIDTWLLGKPLQDQSEECIDSLIKLLK